MDRKKFLAALGGIPLLNIPFRAIANSIGNDMCRTQKDAEGPFYKANAPLRSVIETEGERLKIEGQVFQSDDCKTPLQGAVLDIWHCDNDGNYDLKGFKGRGQVTTGKDGRYSFSTIFPPPYGSRPRHIHIKVRAAGKTELTTQLYFRGDPNIQNDFARNAETDRVIPLKTVDQIKTGVFDIYL